MKLSIRRRLLAASLIMSALLVAAGVVAYWSVASISADARAVTLIAQEHDHFLELQLALAKALVPPGEYLITGSSAHRADSVEHFAAVDAGLRSLRHSTLIGTSLVDIAARVAMLRELGGRILALPNPVGNREGMRLMAAMDQAAHDLIGEMDRLHRVHKTAMDSAVTQQDQARAQATRILIAVAMATTVLSLTFGLVLSRSIIRPIAALQRGAETIGSGNLSYRLEIAASDEIGRLAQKFNAMADQLEDSYATLEQRVAERTRALAEANRKLQAHHQIRQALLARVISVQEDERRRIARELHDETSQTIAILSMNLDFLRSTVTDMQLKEQLAKLRAVAEGTLERIHKVIFDLRPRILDDLGLTPAIAGYLDGHLRPLGIEARLEAYGLENRLPPEVETAVFRIVQEAVTNVIKHARAQWVHVCLDFNGALLVMFVEDDGVGFEPRLVLHDGNSAGGLGLLGIQERVAYLRGTMNIHSHPGGGTRLYVEIPVESSWSGSEFSLPTTTPSSERASALS